MGGVHFAPRPPTPVQKCVAIFNKRVVIITNYEVIASKREVSISKRVVTTSKCVVIKCEMGGYPRESARPTDQRY